MESIICSPTEWTLMACEHFKGDSVFLNRKGACAVVKYVALHLEREFEHASKSVTNPFVGAWKQNLVMTVVPCFWFGITSIWFECMWDLSTAWRYKR